MVARIEQAARQLGADEVQLALDQVSDSLTIPGYSSPIAGVFIKTL